MVFRLFLVIFTSIFFTSMPVSYAGSSDKLGILLNKVRLDNAQQAVKKSEILTLVAQKHADDMARNNYFSHIGQNGSSPHQRVTEENYAACYSAENIAKGQKKPSTVMEDWMNSEGHRANNLSTRAKEYGIGKSGRIWVLVLATKCSRP